MGPQMPAEMKGILVRRRSSDVSGGVEVCVSGGRGWTGWWGLACRGGTRPFPRTHGTTACNSLQTVCVSCLCALLEGRPQAGKELLAAVCQCRQTVYVCACV